MKLFPQETNVDLKNKISSLIESIESTGDETPKDKIALQIARQLRHIYDTGNSDQLRTIPNYLNSVSSEEHKKQFSEILQRMEKELSEREEKLRKEEEKFRKEWLEKIEAFAQATEKACLDDASASELMKLLIASDKISSLNRPSTKSSVEVIKEASSKFSSATQLLQAWLAYKRYEEKGYIKQALERLKYLSRSRSAVPILDKSFLDQKIVEMEKKAVPGRPASGNSNYLSPSQLDIIEKLNTGKLEAGIFLTAADQLRVLSKGNDSISNYTSQLGVAIEYLAECLFALKAKDMVNARGNFTVFYGATGKIRQLEDLRERAVFELVPILYASIGAKAPAPKQSVNSYLLRLFSEPKNSDEIKTRQELLNLYGRYTPDNLKRPKWIQPAEVQYSAMLNAKSAMNTGHYKSAVEYFQKALKNAPDSGPASATKYIELQIKNLLEEKPDVSDPSFSEALSDIIKRLKDIETKLNTMQPRSVR